MLVARSRFAYAGLAGEHPVHDTQIKRLRHPNFFQHECYLEVRVPRVRLPDGSVRPVEPEWVGQLDGFTLLFEALVLLLAQQMPFAAGAHRQSVVASGACHLLALCGTRAGVGEPVGRQLGGH